MNLKKFMGWAMAASLVFGVPAITAALQDGTAGGSGGGKSGVFESTTGTDGGTTEHGSGSSSLEIKDGIMLADAASGSASSSTGSPEEQGMQPTGTGASGISPDSTTRMGRGDSSGGMGTQGGTREVTPDTMRRGMKFHGMTSTDGMRNMTGMPGATHGGY